VVKNLFVSRGLLAVALLVAVALAVTGCGNSSSSSSASGSSGSSSGSSSASSGGASGTIRFLGLSTTQTPMTQIISSFEKANPGIHVNAQYLPPGSSYAQTLTTQVQGGNTPDVFYTDGGEATNGSVSVLPLAKAGKLVDLSGQPWASTVPQAAHSLYWIGNKLYGLPLYESPSAVEYNVSEFQKLGLTVPTTWAQMLQLCSKIKAAGKIPAGEPGQAAIILPLERAVSLVYGNAPNWNAQRAAGQVTFAGTPGWAESLASISQMNKAGCFQPGAAGTSVPAAFQLVGSGQAVMFIGPVDALGAIEPIAHGAKFAAFPLPGDTAATTQALVGYSDALAVSSSSSSKAAAIKFIDFIASPAEADYLAKMTGTVSLAAAASGHLPAALSAFAPYYKANKLVSYPPDGWTSGGPLNTAMLPLTSGLFTGQQTPESVLKAMDAQWGK
jgi:raffinose/stachyose/melibiose transport system substrate-binding protein